MKPALQNLPMIQCYFQLDQLIFKSALSNQISNNECFDYIIYLNIVLHKFSNAKVAQVFNMSRDVI